MPAARTEPARATEEKPAREPQPEPASPPQVQKGEGWKAWLPLGVAVLVMPALAYLTTSFVLIPRMQKALRSTEAAGSAPAEKAGEAPAAIEGGAPAGQGQNVTLNKLLVNVAGTMGSRYLLSSLTLVGKGSDFASRVAQHEPQLRDFASGLLSTKTIADLEKPGARNVIRSELLAGFNGVLGNGSLQEIYFTEFAIQ